MPFAPISLLYSAPTILLLLGYLSYAFVALAGRRQAPKRASLGMAGFLLIALGVLITLLNSMLARVLIDGGFELFRTVNVASSVLNVLLQLTGATLLLMALRKKDDDGSGTPQPGAHGGQPYAQQQWQQPGQQPPPQYPGQQHPSQQYPGQQHPGQQYPGY